MRCSRPSNARGSRICCGRERCRCSGGQYLETRGGGAVSVPPLALRPLLLLLGGGEEDVVEDQAVAGGVPVLGEIGGRVAHHVLVVLGIVAAQERERAAPELP